MGLEGEGAEFSYSHHFTFSSLNLVCVDWLREFGQTRLIADKRCKLVFELEDLRAHLEGKGGEIK